MGRGRISKTPSVRLLSAAAVLFALYALVTSWDLGHIAGAHRLRGVIIEKTATPTSFQTKTEVEPWSGRAALGSDGIDGQPQPRCHFVEQAQGFQVTTGQGHSQSPRTYRHCVHAYDDMVSNAVKKFGYWPGCKQLWDLYNEPARANPDVVEGGRHNTAGGGGVFVDVGANIGSCTAPFLLAGIDTVSFEPSKPTLFYLTSTVLANAGMAEHLRLYPVALSDAVGEHTLFLQDGNRGNAVLDNPVLGGKNNRRKRPGFDQALRVRTERLDDVLWPRGEGPPPHVRVMKVDAQGYEAHIFAGAERLLRAGAVGIVKFEIASEFLEAQGTNSSALFHALHDFGFDMYDVEGAHVQPIDFGVIRDVTKYVDMVARYNGPRDMGRHEYHN